MSVASQSIGLLANFVRIIPVLLIAFALVFAYITVEGWISENCDEDESVITCVSEAAGEGVVQGIFGGITGVAAGILAGAGRLGGRIQSGIASRLKIPTPSFNFNLK
tara:strand:- start:844 stop:1164 length:321 start_codon:yes stop_codon:yes gene_type:complete